MTPQELESVVKLTLAKIEIVKLKHANAGYDWSMFSKDGKELLDKALIDIDDYIKQLKDLKMPF